MSMRRLLRSPLLYYLRLPMPLRIGMLFCAGGGSIYMLTYFFRGRSFWIIAIGMAVVAALLVLFRQTLKRRKKRKAAPMEQGIVDQSAAAPQAITEAGRRARLDDLRRNFEEGIGKFRAAGKDLYSLPWYVIVGEPGSGKTEAVRHSSVGFPPGLQDPFQGAGGTINMNWWFTNHAVLLDTAGRLMFEEVEAGGTSEWQEFLELLHAHRPNCPVNGLMLVIPADTLITDTADAIKSKAEKIAHQLDLIRRTLAVRFPVFVLITKCDLVNGFREFFEGVTDPALQHQMLGWSNPAPLDEPFNPELVDQHLATVCEQLRRRRLTLLIDPVHTEDPVNGHRLDQVDALYAFPLSLSRIASRLRLYLEMVFAGGAWSGKPLFLRGIYFTSAMREGAALDEELAEALGVPVESLPDGRVWERDRSYFLRDVCLEKAFKERGLVTRAADAGGQHRRRKAIVLAAGFLSVLILGLLTWLGARALNASIGRHRDYWVAASREGNWKPNEVSHGRDYWRPIVTPEYIGSPNWVYSGNVTLSVGGKEMRIAEFHTLLHELAGSRIRVPWVFWLARVGTAGLDSKRLKAHQALFESGVLRPVVDAARAKMLEDTDAWPQQANDALAQLILLEAPDGELSDLDPLYQVVLLRHGKGNGNGGSTMPVLPGAAPAPAAAAPATVAAASTRAAPAPTTAAPAPATAVPPAPVPAPPPVPPRAPARAEAPVDQYLKSYLLDRDALNAVMAWIYGGGKGKWPPEAMGIGSDGAHQAIHAGVDRFIRHWRGKGQSASVALGQIVDIRDLILKTYKDTEAQLLGLDDEFTPRLARPAAAKVEIIGAAAKAWGTRLAALQQARTEAEAKLAAFPDGPLTPSFERQSSGIFQEIEAAFTHFREQAGLTEAEPDAAGSSLLKKLKGAAKKAVEKGAKKKGIKPGTAKPATAGAPGAAKPATGAPPEPGDIVDALGAAAARSQRLRGAVDDKLLQALDRIRKIARPDAVANDVARVDTEFLNHIAVEEHVWRRLVELGLVQPQGDRRTLQLYEYRFLMYTFADAERRKRDAAAARASFRGAVQRVRQNIELASNQITQLKDLDPKAFRFEDAAGVSVFTCRRLALPQRVYLMLHDLLAKRPQREEDVAAHVAARAAAYAPVVKPTIPLTSMRGGQFEPRCHPDATLAMLREWADAGMTLQDQKLEVLQRDALIGLWQRWGGACGAFLTGEYYRYWTQKVPGELESHGDDWKSFRKTWAETQRVDARIFLDLGGVGKAMTKGLSTDIEQFLPTATRENFNRARAHVSRAMQQLESKEYPTQCKLVRSNWCKLSDDAFEARNVLIGLPRDQIFEEYLPFLYSAPAEFANKYWTDLTHEALRLIITWAGRTGLESLGVLQRQYSRFPLDVPRAGEAALTPKEVSQARALVERLVATARQRGVKTGDDRRGEAARREVERLLDQLITLKVDPAAWAWLQKLKTVLDGLPGGEKALKCELWLVAKDAPRPAVGDRWAHIRIHQGKAEVGKGPSAPGEDYKLCDVWYPGDQVDLRFWLHPQDEIRGLPPNRTLAVEGPWAAVRLLHPGQVSDPLSRRWQFVHKWQVMDAEARRENPDPKVRDILITIEDEQRIRRQLRLRLTFEKALPKTDEWPTRPRP